MSLDENLIAQSEHAEVEQTAEQVESAPIEEVDETAEGQEAETDTDEPKKKSGFERRVEKLNRKATEAKLEAEFWKQKALGQNQEQAPPATQNRKPQFADYNDIDQFTEALAEWKVDQKLSNYEASQKQKTVEHTYVTRKQEFEKSNPDFAEVLDDVAHVVFNQAAMSFISESDVGPAIAYELGKNPDEAERIGKLSAVRQIAELAKIEDKLTQKKPVIVKASKAPAPIKPTTGKGAVKSVDISDPNLSYADFKRLRAEQLKRK